MPHEHRRLLQGQVLGGLAEVALGGGFDSVRLLPEVRDVEVVLEDLLLPELLLDLDRVLELADLSPEALLLGLADLRLVVARLFDEDVLDVLLGQRRGALRRAALLRVAVDRAQDALEVDGSVLVEAGVLDRDDRLLHVRGDGREGDHLPVARIDRGDQATLGVQNRGALAQGRRLEIGRDLIEPFDRALGRESQRACARDRDAREHNSGENGHTEELGGLLWSREPAARALLSHGGQPTFSFAGHTRMPWPKLPSTVTAVRWDINPSACFSPFPNGVDACPNLAPCDRVAPPISPKSPEWSGMSHDHSVG